MLNIANNYCKSYPKKLILKYGKGFSVTTLKDIRQFYKTYSAIPIRHALRGELVDSFNLKLSWTHYRALMRVSRPEARSFYEFLNLPESHLLVESDLEQALIDNLHHFLLELGSGFAFIARQKRLTLDGDNN